MKTPGPAPAGRSGIKEADLFPPVRDFFAARGFEIRSELADCDITAVKDGIIVAVELKIGLTLPLLTQAVKRQRFCDLVYIAVPRPTRLSPRKRNDILHLIRRLELGLLYVGLSGGSPRVETAAEPLPFDRAASVNNAASKKRRAALIAEFSARTADYNIGGTTGVPRVTAYREKALYIACCLSLYQSLKIAELKRLGCDRKTSDIIHRNFYGWFLKDGRGPASLSEAGRAAVFLYNALSEGFLQKIRAVPQLPEK